MHFKYSQLILATITCVNYIYSIYFYCLKVFYNFL